MTANGVNGNGPSEWRFDLDRDLLCVADAAGRFTSLNAAWEHVLGWSRDELMSRPFIEFVHPEDVEATIREASGVTRPDSAIADFVNRYRTRDGDYRWLRWSARSDGETWFAVAIDITEQRRREDELRAVLSGDRLLAYSQPIMDQRSEVISHEELLVRLRAVAGGPVAAPATFLPDAERLGLIGIVDRWMLTQALELASRGRVSNVNLSARSIDDPDVTAQVCEVMEAAPEHAPRVIFEITETAALEHLDAAREFTARLVPLGCRFALDDFGTGFGSLTYLRHLPVEYLKIDQSFVRALATDADDRSLVRSVVAIARELGLRTVAEGVEDAPTLRLLREYGVDEVQGYLIGRPVPVAPRV
jgi:PAS domain S-box-containing protein